MTEENKDTEHKEALAWRLFVIHNRETPIEECREVIQGLLEQRGDILAVETEIKKLEAEKKANNRFREGAWVCFKVGPELKHGVVVSRDGDDITVNVAHGTETVPRWILEDSSNGNYFTQIAERAYKSLNWKDGDVWKVHSPIANGREKLSFEVLAELDLYISKLICEQNANDSWESIEHAAASVNADSQSVNETELSVNATSQLVNTGEEEDIFAAFGITDLEPIDPKPELDTAKSVDGDAVSSDCAISAPSANDVSECASTAADVFPNPIFARTPEERIGRERSKQVYDDVEAQKLIQATGHATHADCESCMSGLVDDELDNSALSDVVTVSDKKMLPILERLGVTPEQMLDKLKASQEAVIREKYAHVLTDESGELVGDLGEKTINEMREEADLLTIRESQDVIRQELNQPLTVKGAGDYMVDPETGEVLEESAILRTLGWTEYPKLSDEPSTAELETFESRCDEVTDRINRYREQTARWRRQAEERSAPLDKAADFWENFLRPLLKSLAVHRLPKYKSGKKAGQYRVKTLKLASGSWKFTQVGGINVFDWNLVQKTIEKEGVEKHSDYAKTEVKVNGKKFLALAREGKVRADFPGLKLTEANPLGKVSNATKGDTTSEDDDE